MNEEEEELIWQLLTFFGSFSFISIVSISSSVAGCGKRREVATVGSKRNKQLQNSNVLSDREESKSKPPSSHNKSKSNAKTDDKKPDKALIEKGKDGRKKNEEEKKPATEGTAAEKTNVTSESFQQIPIHVPSSNRSLKTSREYPVPASSRTAREKTQQPFSSRTAREQQQPSSSRAATTQNSTRVATTQNSTTRLGTTQNSSTNEESQKQSRKSKKEPQKQSPKQSQKQPQQKQQPVVVVQKVSENNIAPEDVVPERPLPQQRDVERDKQLAAKALHNFRSRRTQNVYSNRERNHINESSKREESVKEPEVRDNPDEHAQVLSTDEETGEKSNKNKSKSFPTVDTPDIPAAQKIEGGEKIDGAEDLENNNKEEVDEKEEKQKEKGKKKKKIKMIKCQPGIYVAPEERQFKPVSEIPADDITIKRKKKKKKKKQKKKKSKKSSDSSSSEESK